MDVPCAHAINTGVPLPDTFVLVDLETTGANPVRDRITEIAIIRVEYGQITHRWQSLVNPQQPIPPHIQRLIGITDNMVADAPTFAELAGQTRTRLEKAIFIAHNVRFDYGFIRNEYIRIGQTFDASVLCTVKLSRALYPEHHRHGLDALIERHGFTCEARHRAMGDTDVLWQFIQLVKRSFPDEILTHARERAMKQSARPPALPEGALEGLPETPGVYQFYGEENTLLVIGQASNLRSHIMALIAPQGHKKSKIAQMFKQIHRLEWQETAGELDALLQELQRLKTATVDTLIGSHAKTRPASNPVFGLRPIPGRKNPPIFEHIPLTGSDPATWENLFGILSTRKEADNLLRELATLYQLCPRRLGLEPDRKGPCTAYQNKRCLGVCLCKESNDAHDQRLLGALNAVRLKAWPWITPIIIHEQTSNGLHEAHHLFDHWCYLGTANSDAALQTLISSLPARGFDIDHYRILHRWLANDANKARVKPLNV